MAGAAKSDAPAAPAESISRRFIESPKVDER
jgi:hypothetical protein